MRTFTGAEAQMTAKQQTLLQLFCKSLSVLKTMSSRDVKCKISDSPIHGKGVFAAENIAPGTTITYYPPHGVAMICNGRMIFTGTDYVDPSTKVKKCMRLPTRDEIEDYTYFIDADACVQIVGFCDEIDNHMCVGHMINDGNRLCKSGIQSETEYNQSSSVDNNAKFELNARTCTVRIVATKNIRSGEEIMCSYGFHYWNC